MKVYLLVVRDRIVGITESKKIANRFIKERSNINPVAHKVKDKDLINKALIDLVEDFNLEEDPLLGIILSNIETRTLMSEIHQEFNRIITTRRDMGIMLKRYTVDDEVRKGIEKGYNALSKLIEAETFGRSFGVDVVMRHVLTNSTRKDAYIK